MSYRVMQKIEKVSPSAPWFAERIRRAFEGIVHVAEANVDTDNLKGVIREGRIPEGIEEFISANKLRIKHVVTCVRNNTETIYLILKNDEFVVEIDIYKDITWLSVGSGTGMKDAGIEFLNKLKDAIPQKTISEDESIIPFTFWRYSERSGAICHDNEIQCDLFDSLQENYPDHVARRIKYLAQMEDPSQHGRIILWHGPPGTGKTHAVRALARHWYNDLAADVEVILDPEKLFGDPNYLFDMVLGRGETPLAYSTRTRMKQRDEIRRDLHNDGRQPLRLFIAEDSAELFADNCRAMPGFSRLLNVSDGLIGQGLNVVFLFTANEPLERFDPALLRKGRALQVLEFPYLSEPTACEWLENKGVDKDTIREALTENRKPALSDLYHILNQSQADDDVDAPQNNRFGFQPVESR